MATKKHLHKLLTQSPVVSTTSVSNILGKYISGGNILSMEVIEVTARGVCWSIIKILLLLTTKPCNGSSNIL
jgi:hypothetical protein